MEFDFSGTGLFCNESLLKGDLAQSQSRFDQERKKIREESRSALRTLMEGTGPGSEFRGWIDLPLADNEEEERRILATAERLRGEVEALVVIGIGGSYLGARAIYEALKNPFSSSLKEGLPELIFAGYHLSSEETCDLLDKLKGKNFAINVISKSGTTMETGICFRLLRRLLEKQLGKDLARKRIFVTTDRGKGALKALADKKGYEKFVIPENIGGRFTVLSAVGLFPLAVGGVDIAKLLEGARKGRETDLLSDFEKNPALVYAFCRNYFYRQGMAIEILLAAEPRLRFFQEWWKQLFGESEGKEGKGLFPASASITTDLHSLGQWIQEGPKNHMETFLWVEEPKRDLSIPREAEDFDRLNYLEGKGLHEVNEKALLGTIQAHRDGGVPTILIRIKDLSPESLGQLIYFFEASVGISAYLLGVNPFNQPGVEQYKKNMGRLLGKPE